jgi:hypothetical protein
VTRRRQARRQRLLDVFDRYPGVKLRGLDVTRMAFGSVDANWFELYRLEHEGAVTSEWDHPDGDAYPRHRVYWLVHPGGGS